MCQMLFWSRGDRHGPCLHRDCRSVGQANDKHLNKNRNKILSAKCYKESKSAVVGEWRPVWYRVSAHYIGIIIHQSIMSLPCLKPCLGPQVPSLSPALSLTGHFPPQLAATLERLFLILHYARPLWPLGLCKYYYTQQEHILFLST